MRVAGIRLSMEDGLPVVETGSKLVVTSATTATVGCEQRQRSITPEPSTYRENSRWGVRGRKINGPPAPIAGGRRPIH